MNYQTTWTNEEFQAYVLLCAAQADLVETEEEKNMILTKVDQTIYEKIHAEVDTDNDYQRAQKILSTVERLGYTPEDKLALKREIAKLFMSDGKIATLEKNLMLVLTKLIG